MVLLLCLTALSHAVPSQLPGVETVLVGPAARPKPAAALGTWEVDPDGVHLTDKAPVGDLDYWLLEPTVGDGFVRARFALAAAPDLTLLLRATVGDRPEALDALGVSVEKDKLVLHRWREGHVAALGSSVPVADLASRKSLELAVWLVGPQLVAVLHDGETLEALATVTGTDRTFARGRLGVRVHPDRRETTSLTSLTVLSTQLGAAPAPPATDEFGERRLVRYPHGTLADGDVVRRVPEGELAVFSAERVEALRRRGVEPLAATGHLPHWVDDPRYRATMWRPYPRTPDGWFDLGASYKDWLQVQYILLGLAEKHPDLARPVLVGRTTHGRPIWGLRLGDADDTPEPSVLFVAAHHGSELPAADHALDVAQWLLQHRAEPLARDVLRELDVWVVPMVNADGNWAYLQVDQDYGRRNGADTDRDGTWEPWEGVDLNRNYPFAWGLLGEKGSRSWRGESWYRGPSPGSEPEITAMTGLGDQQRFAAMLSFHTYATKLLSPYTIDGQRNPDPDVAWALAEDMVAATAPQPNGKRYEVVRKLYSVDGTDQDWFFHEHGTLAFLLESSMSNRYEGAQWQAAIDGSRGASTVLLQDVLRGPWIGGVVTDPTGAPVEAEVRVSAPAPREGEVWTSRPGDGRYDRRVPGPGRYTVTARADGYAPVTRQVVVDDGRVELDLVLRPASAQ